MQNENEAKTIKKADVENAFDELARFLFQQYKKKKQAEEDTKCSDTTIDQSQ